MLKDLFIPERIGEYYIQSKKVLGFEVTQTHIYACYLTLHGKKIEIESFFSKPIPQTNDSHIHIEQIIASIVSQVDKEVEIHSCIASSHAIFKTLKLPFTSREKISKVIDYEVEPSLPFPLKRATIDFIITKSNDNDHLTEVLVVAVQQTYISQNVLYYKQSGHSPSLVTVDMIALYQLYSRIPDYASAKGVTILMDIDRYETRLIYIVEGQLKLIRNLTKGFPDCITKAANYLQLSLDEVLVEYNKPDSTHIKAIEPFIEPLLGDIAFTINSFKSQAGTANQLQMLVLTEEPTLKNIDTFLSKKLSIPVAFFKVDRLLQNKDIKLKKGNTIPSRNYISLATALPSSIEADFNLYNYKLSDQSIINTYKQLVTAGILTSIVAISLLFFNIFQLRKFKKELHASIQETVATLVQAVGQKIKPKSLTPSIKLLQRVVADAEREVAAKEKVWFTFSAPAQVTYLRYLYELFTGLNQEELGLNIKKIDLREGLITLDGSVKDYDALEQLDQFVQASPLFGKIIRGSLQEPTFNIDIELNKTGDLQ